MATPKPLKRLLQSNAVQTFASLIGSAYILLVQWTGRLDRPAPPIAGPYILALWHGRLGMLQFLRFGDRPLVALISGHRDGQLISKCAGHFGIITVTGSASRGGLRAARALVRLSREGHSLFVTPDGPRGPRLRADTSIVTLARLTGLPILPVAIINSRGFFLKSWDRFFVPGLFGRTVVRWGEPISARDDADPVATARRLQNALISLQNAADRAVDWPIDPVLAQA
jgi:lysophospholipid acyltransferase (LPLAT)-like uncharacterized protein